MHLCGGEGVFCFAAFTAMLLFYRHAFIAFGVFCFAAAQAEGGKTKQAEMRAFVFLLRKKKAKKQSKQRCERSTPSALRSKKSKPCFVFISGYALACFAGLLRKKRSKHATKAFFAEQKMRSKTPKAIKAWR
jgi:hypothetical protein